jgi:hypothetical protein
MATAEIDRLVAVKAALLQTTSTIGWHYIKQMSDNIVAKWTQEALDEEDPVKGESKRLKAKAMQAGMRDLFNAVEVAKGFNADAEKGWFDDLDSFQGKE